MSEQAPGQPDPEILNSTQVHVLGNFTNLTHRISNSVKDPHTRNVELYKATMNSLGQAHSMQGTASNEALMTAITVEGMGAISDYRMVGEFADILNRRGSLSDTIRREILDMAGTTLDHRQRQIPETSIVRDVIDRLGSNISLLTRRTAEDTSLDIRADKLALLAFAAGVTAGEARGDIAADMMAYAHQIAAASQS